MMTPPPVGSASADAVHTPQRPLKRTLLLAALLIGCAHDKTPARTITADEATDIAHQAVAEHGLSTDAINGTHFWLQQDGTDWRVAAVFPMTPDGFTSHAIIRINNRGKVTDYSSR